jgi:hypothetical protein
MRRYTNAGKGLSVLAIAGMLSLPLLLIGCDEQKSRNEVKRTTETPNEKVTQTQKEETKVNPK